MNNEPLQAMDDDEILDYTQLMRRRYVGHVTNDGSQMPNDAKDATVLLKALADMDRTAIGKKRIKTEEAATESNAQAIAAMASQIAQSITGHRPADPESRTAPVLDDSNLPPLESAPGEMDIGIHSESYENFEKRIKGEAPVEDEE